MNARHLGTVDSLLSVDSVVAGYGRKPVLRGVSLHVGCGEIVAVVGHNGAGKSTLLKSVFGQLRVWDGQVMLDGKVLISHEPRELLRKGVAYVPQGNRVFTDLTVRENLQIGATTLEGASEQEQGIERALRLFTALKPRLYQRAGTLSGGEKQMLALANALTLSPRLLLLDEPSLGLAPRIVAEALNSIQQLSRDSRVGVLVVEQKVREVLKIAHRVYVLRNGEVSFEGTAEALDDATLREVYF